MDWYEYSDKQYARLQKKIHREFTKSRLLMPFDDINQMSINKRVKPPGTATMDVRRECRRLYRRLKKLNHDCFADIWLYVYLWHMREMDRDKPISVSEAIKYVDMWLSGYDPVTKYVYNHEVDRKEARLFEAVVADGATGNVRGFESDYSASERLWQNMTKQYIIDIEDFAAKTAYKDAGVPYVMWMTEHDDRVCEDCEPLDGLVFRLDRVPDKPHYGCRCTLKPWRVKS